MDDVEHLAASSFNREWETIRDYLKIEREACARAVWKARRPSCVEGCTCAFCLMLQNAAEAIRARGAQ
jgi:hypothetical protein